MKKIAAHILFWLAILYWRTKGDFIHAGSLEQFFYQNLIRLPVMIVATYFLTEYILPKYLIEKKDYFRFVGLFLLNFITASWLDRVIIGAEFMTSILEIDTYNEYKIFRETHPFRNTFMLFSIMSLASLIQFFQLLRNKEKKEAALIEEHLSTKLAFLKMQVNPHFLFNALNNIYSMAVQKEQQEIAVGLENLSGIMYYLTYESSVDFVPLEKEIILLKNYVDIHHLRVADTDDTTISFNVEGETAGKIIAPVILLPLVENAFKHGIKPDKKCIVSIQILVKNGFLNFKTTNTFFEKSEKEVKNKGIGLENVLKRLEILYPKKYAFETNEKKGYFYLDLKLPLK